MIVITYFSIVIGELVPKRIGQFNPEDIARRVARPMNLLALLARPFVRLLSVSTDAILRLLGKQQSSQADVIEEEIHALLQEGSESGVIEQQERDMVRNVLRLDDRPINSLMIPRSDIVYLDTTLPLEDNLKRVAESEHSRFPVCRDGLDTVLGIISAKQLFNQTLSGGQTGPDRPAHAGDLRAGKPHRDGPAGALSRVRRAHGAGRRRIRRDRRPGHAAECAGSR